jgi:hypothetical protein
MTVHLCGEDARQLPEIWRFNPPEINPAAGGVTQL